LLWKLAFIVQGLWVASRHVESGTNLFFRQFTLSNSTVLGGMKNVYARYRETYDEKKKVFSVQHSLGLYFKTLKPVQHSTCREAPEKQHCQQNPTKSQMILPKSQSSNRNFPTKLRRLYFKNADDTAPSSP